MSWIKCADQMPEDFTMCLIVTETGERISGYFTEGIFYDGLGHEISVRVAYWQPWPELPEVMQEYRDSMIEPITRERWLEAQVAEVLATTYDNPGNAKDSYAKIFDYLGIDFDQHGKSIIEVGCGAFPAVSFCNNAKPTIVEPLEFPQLEKYVEESSARWIRKPLEEILYNLSHQELWCFNAMQHVRDPEMFIEKCKELAPVIRFFEPVDYPTCAYHPHTFSQADFERWFPGCVKRYTDRLEGFFDSDCVYGTWRADV